MSTNLLTRTGLLLLGASCLLAAGPQVAGACPSPQGTWTELTPASDPGLRSGYGIATDGTDTYLFGGRSAGGSARHNDLWMYDGTTWTDITPATSPLERDSPGMTYDSVRGRVVIFGGEGEDTSGTKIMLDDTWEYDPVAGTWTQLSPTNFPPKRLYARMAYFPGLGSVLYSGKDTVASPKITYGDTWVWDGIDWTDLSATAGSPGLRASCGLAYDSQRGRIVQYGGRDDAGVQSDQTWTFDGAIWTQIVTTAYPGSNISVPLYNGSMCYHPGVDQVVWFGGNGITPATSAKRDTWLFDGTDWTMQAFIATDPSRRTSQSMIYVSALDKVLMYGGYDGSRKDDTWVYDIQPAGPGTQYCSGDGTGTACPCGNVNDGSMSGCDWQSSGGLAGGALDATGTNLLANNDTFLVASNISANFGVFFVGPRSVESLGLTLGDGLRCVGGGAGFGPAIRLIPPTNPGGSIATHVVPLQTLDPLATTGVTRHYQYWFRTDPGACGATVSSNTTNAYEITWM